MVKVVFEERYQHRPLRILYRLHQLHIKNGERVFIDSKNEDDCGWYEVIDQYVGVGTGLLSSVTQFFTLMPVTNF